VASIIKQSHVGAFQRFGELPYRAIHTALIEIDPFYDLETQLFRRRCHIRCIIFRIIEHGGITISRVADDQRHTVF
jgi:hypothetical protein